MSRPSTPAVEAPDPGDRRYRALVAYDGAAFHGFAANPGVATVGGTLATSLQRILGYQPALTCAGRTDRGVHAWGQVVSFDAADTVDCQKLQRSLNAMCAPAIVIRELDAAAPDFDARFSANQRTYRYRVLNRPWPDPFLHATTWHVPHNLDIDAMNAAGHHLVGEHDFSSFCRKRTVTVAGEAVEASLTRKVVSLEWRAGEDDIIELWVSATAFCHQMVRAITGTLVEVGSGKRSVASLPDTLAARDRHHAGALAPPDGLTLWSVDYGDASW